MEKNILLFRIVEEKGTQYLEVSTIVSNKTYWLKHKLEWIKDMEVCMLLGWWLLFLKKKGIPKENITIKFLQWIESRLEKIIKDVYIYNYITYANKSSLE